MNCCKLFALTSAAALLLVSSCKNDEFDENGFADSNPDGKICLSIDKSIIMEYDEKKHQIGFNDRKNEFRVSDDSMQTYFVVRLERMPSSEGEFISSKVDYSVNGSRNTKDCNFKVTRLEENGRKIWLWSNESKIGAVVMDLAQK